MGVPVGSSEEKNGKVYVDYDSQDEEELEESFIRLNDQPVSITIEQDSTSQAQNGQILDIKVFEIEEGKLTF
jgi:hypothetical protein